MKKNQHPYMPQPTLVDACKLALARKGFAVSCLFDPAIQQYRITGNRNEDEYPLFSTVGRTMEEAYVRACMSVKINP